MLLNIFSDKDAAAIAKIDWDTLGGTAISEDNPLAGCRIHVVATDTVSKAGKPFTRMIFTPPSAPSEFQIELAKEARK